MADFKPTAPFWVYDKDRAQYMSVGWYSYMGDWTDVEPMIENPDSGGGLKPWQFVHGADPWYATKPKT